MDEATKTRLDDAYAALAELGAAQAQAASLLGDIKHSIESGDPEKAVSEETVLREAMRQIGRACIEFAEKSIVVAEESSG